MKKLLTAAALAATSLMAVPANAFVSEPVVAPVGTSGYYIDVLGKNGNNTVFEVSIIYTSPVKINGTKVSHVEFEVQTAFSCSATMPKPSFSMGRFKVKPGTFECDRDSAAPWLSDEDFDLMINLVGTYHYKGMENTN